MNVVEYKLPEDDLSISLHSSLESTLIEKLSL